MNFKTRPLNAIKKIELWRRECVMEKRVYGVDRVIEKRLCVVEKSVCESEERVKRDISY
jgi:hypothetical protein